MRTSMVCNHQTNAPVDMMVARDGIMGRSNDGGPRNVEMAKECYAMHENDRDRRNSITSLKQ
jgi:hypothetical protein